jgi:hypothetical protein
VQALRHARVVCWGAIGQNLVLLPAASSAVEVATRFTEHLGDMRLGTVLVVLVVGFYIPWTAVLGVQMARIEGRFPVLASIQLIRSSGSRRTSLSFDDAGLA